MFEMSLAVLYKRTAVRSVDPIGLSLLWIFIFNLVASSHAQAAPAVGAESQLVRRTTSAGKAPEKPKSKATVLEFLPDVSCGRLFVCASGWDFEKDCASSTTAGRGLFTVLGDAKGAVMVPAGAMLKLVPSAQLLHQPSLIDGVPIWQFVFLSLYGAEPDDDTVKLVAKFTHLRRLDLTYSDLNDQILKKFQPCSELEYLFLNKTPIQGSTIGHFTYLKKLRMLSVAGDYLKPEGYRQIAQLRSVEHLDLSHTAIDDESLAYMLKNLPNLQFISLVNCLHITDKSADSLRTAPKLSSIDLCRSNVGAESLFKLNGKQVKLIRLTGDERTNKGISALKKHFPKTSIEVYGSSKSFSVREAEKMFHPLR